jgi:hypothetical protein
MGSHFFEYLPLPVYKIQCIYDFSDAGSLSAFRYLVEQLYSPDEWSWNRRICDLMTVIREDVSYVCISSICGKSCCTKTLATYGTRATGCNSQLFSYLLLWEANSCSASREITRFLWALRFFLTVFTSVHQRPLFWARCITSISFYPISSRPILILSHLRPGLPGGPFP